MTNQELFDELEKRLRELQVLRQSMNAIRVTPEMEKARIVLRENNAYTLAIKAMMEIVDEIAED